MIEDIFNADKIKKKFAIDKRNARTLSVLLNTILSLRTVNMAKLSEYCNRSIKQESMYRKMQRFIAGVNLPEDKVAELIMETIGYKECEPIILVMDRTYWMYGKTHLNFLYLNAYYRGYSVPWFFKMMPDKKGHSNMLDRQELIEKFIGKFGKERIAYIVADREFDGHEWLQYLERMGIDYVQRLKENIIQMTNSRGEFKSAASLCREVKIGEKEDLGCRKIYKKHKHKTNITVARNQENKVLLLAHSRSIKDPVLAYSLRWGIEAGFRAMKSGGFNMEATHLVAPERICNLHRIVGMLMAFCLKLGILMDEKVPIKLKKHGRKARSFIRLAIIALIQPKAHRYQAFKHIRPILKIFFSSYPIATSL